MRKNYIFGNWAGIMESVKAKDKSLQCSAEGYAETGSIPEKSPATGCRCRRSDIFVNADAGCRKAQQGKTRKTGRYAGIQHSVLTYQKDSSIKNHIWGL